MPADIETTKKRLERQLERGVTEFTYMSKKGETTQRRVRLDSIDDKAGVGAWDLDRKGYRYFLLAGISELRTGGDSDEAKLGAAWLAWKSNPDVVHVREDAELTGLVAAVAHFFGEPNPW